MTTSTSTTTKTKTQILEDVVSEKNLSDVEFLEEIVAELDGGWTTGSMCDDTGKCLVGAGAAALGLNYEVVYSQRCDFDDSSGLIQDRSFIIAFSEKIRGMEFASAKRLIKLIGVEMGLSRFFLDAANDDAYDPGHVGKGDVIGAVTSFNDGTVPDYLALRRILTDKIKELRGILNEVKG